MSEPKTGGNSFKSVWKSIWTILLEKASGLDEKEVIFSMSVHMKSCQRYALVVDASVTGSKTARRRERKYYKEPRRVNLKERGKNVSAT